MTRGRKPPPWAATVARVVAMMAVCVVVAIALGAMALDAETASRVVLGALAALVVILRGPRGGPPAIAVAAGAELAAQGAHLASLFLGVM